MTPHPSHHAITQTTSFLTTAILIYTHEAGITAAAGTRLSLHLHSKFHLTPTHQDKIIEKIILPH